VLEAAREFRPARLIHTSTSEVYGTALQVPITERHPLQGQSPYSASKIGADKLAEAYFCAFDVPVVTVRPFNTFGPRQSARAIVATIITQMLRSDHVCLGFLEPTRDLTFVRDTVRGFLLAAQAADAAGHVFNLGYGAEISIGNLIRLIADVVGKSVSVVTEQHRTRPLRSEVMRLLSDNSLAREKLGWAPQISLREGLAITTEWIRSHLGFYTSEGYQI
jgi:nucleoside-diphosphate-sugar epimerase